MGKNFNGIIIDGKVYEAVPRGSYHCSDCALFTDCRQKEIGGFCLVTGQYQHIFRFSQSYTDKLNCGLDPHMSVQSTS